MEKGRKNLHEQLTPKQRRGLMHDRFVLLKRERDLNDKEALLLDGWSKNSPELGAAYRNFGNAILTPRILTPRKSTPKAEHPHEPPELPKTYGADINALIELLESGRL